MDELLAKIRELSREEIDLVMEAVRSWFADTYPDWDVMYAALPKDPQQRRQRVEGIIYFMTKDLEENAGEHPAPPPSTV